MIYTLPLIPLREETLLPYTTRSYNITRQSSIEALLEAKKQDGNKKYVILCSQKNKSNASISTIDELNNVGVLAELVNSEKERGLKANSCLFHAISRVVLKIVYSEGAYYVAEGESLDYTYYTQDDLKIKTYLDYLRTSYDDYRELHGFTLPEKINFDLYKNDLNVIVNLVASKVGFLTQEFLEESDCLVRVEMICAEMKSIRNETEIKKSIEISVAARTRKTQKEYMIREQIRILKEELGDDDKTIKDYEEKINNLKIPDDIAEKLRKDLKRMGALNVSSPDYSIMNNYMDSVLSLPWGIYSEDSLDLKKTRQILNEDHYGLDKVKNLILEYLAVKSLATDSKAPILCLVGAPGVGKTSIARSIARAMNKEYISMSLGGIRDESEIRGHRKTYIGAMPGRIMSCLAKAKTSNPVFLFDEIDKMVSDSRFDPSSALLEVLDPAQNKYFRDHYMEVPFDLSQVFFITTANDLSAIQKPLLDRMEVIEMSSYTQEEKFEIAKRYLVPKAMKTCGFSDNEISFKDDAINEIIDEYTREAGVRNLERNIIGVFRKVALKQVEEGVEIKNIDKLLVSNLLGTPIGRDSQVVNGEIGAVNGLAWTSVGGALLPIEVKLLPNGKGDIILTGRLGDVMKESARIAVSLIKSRAMEYGVDAELLNTSDIHIHAPDGATPKDGPSAGITMTTAIMSALKSSPVKKDIAMTGEITLRGKVMPIGGLKEKSIAAQRSGIKNVIIPVENKKNLEDLPKKIAESLNFMFATTIDDVFKYAFE